jgi:hypothetical protein
MMEMIKLFASEDEDEDDEDASLIVTVILLMDPKQNLSAMIPSGKKILVTYNSPAKYTYIKDTADLWEKRKASRTPKKTVLLFTRSTKSITSRMTAGAVKCN